MADAIGDIIRLYHAVTIDPDNNLAFGLGDEGVQTGGHDARGVVKEPDMRLFGLDLLQYQAGIICGHAVCNEDFHKLMRVVLGKHGLQAALNVS